MKIPRGSKQGKYGFNMMGSMTHVRYDHKQRPSKIEIKCPKCGGLAIAVEPCHAEGRLIVGDLNPPWRTPSFDVTCTACLYRAKQQAYGDLTEPYHQIAHHRDILWAWNLAHLGMIADVLRGRSVDYHPYAFVATYIHRTWLKKRRVFAKLLTRYIASNA